MKKKTVDCLVVKSALRFEAWSDAFVEHMRSIENTEKLFIQLKRPVKLMKFMKSGRESCTLTSDRKENNSLNNMKSF